MNRMLFTCALALGLGAPALAQWDPTNAQWGKTAPTDIRVMTWNVQDGICSSNSKLEASNDWTCLARIVAAMKPDILILQETGDNVGEGTGGVGATVDTVVNLTTTIGLFLHGGNDPFTANGPVTAYVQKYDPSYDLPYVFVSGADDGFNRNCILSRFPFADLNGDTKSTLNDIPLIFADTYAPGGTGGIRGFQWAEIDLPNSTYLGDFVMGCAHLKSGSDASSQSQRITASQNVAYYIDYFFNGAGLGVPDPHAKIFDAPQATSILGPNTPVVLGGDWNEDELTNGRKGPAEWLSAAQNVGGTDGTDRDRSDMLLDTSVEFFSGSRATEGNAKFDYIAWEDSIAPLRRSFVFYSNSVPTVSLPVELTTPPGLPAGGRLASATAADHRPVIADFILALRPACPWDLNGDGQIGAADLALLLGSWGAGGGPADFDGDMQVGSTDLATLLGAWGACP